MNRRFLPWLLSLAIVSIVCLLVAVAVQQSYRQGANDPQIQIAEDMAAAFQNNQFTDETLKSSFESFVPTKMQVDIGSSLSPWIQVYNESGEVADSSAILSDSQSIPHIPKSIFVTQGFSPGSPESHAEDRVTWQPQKGIRQAIVVTKFSGLKSGYIVAGRSLREVEVREGKLNGMIVVAWILMTLMIGCSAAWTFGYFSGFAKQKTPRL